MVKVLDLVYSSWKAGQPIVSSNTEYVRQFDRRVLTQTLAAALNRIVGQMPFAERPEHSPRQPREMHHLGRGEVSDLE
jgi:hypothetical protein